MSFYPPPPPNVGGRQPYAGQDLTPPSGPPPQPTAPIAAATFAAILISWLPGPPPVQGQASPQPYHQPPPSQPVPSAVSAVNLSIIRSNWDAAVYWWPLPPGEIIATHPSVNNGPPSSHVNLDIIRGHWDLPLPWWPLPSSPKIVQPGPVLLNVSPLPVALETIRASWDAPPWWPLPSLRALPQSGPAQNPPPSKVNYELIVDIWSGPRQVFKYIGGGDSDGAPATQPPPVSHANFDLIRALWEPPVWWPLPSLNVFPITGTAVILPPPPYDPRPLEQIYAYAWDDSTWTVVYVGSIGSQTAPPQPYAPQPHLIRETWDLPWSADAYQGRATIAAVLPVISAPPPPNQALLALIIAANQPPPYAIPSAGIIASVLPAPSRPPPNQSANLRIVLQAWDLPPPPFFYQPGLAPFIVAPSAPPKTQSANLRIVLQAWDAPPPPFFYQPGLASQVVPPSPPPPTGSTALNLLIDSWRAPVWWPLPSLVQMPQSGIVVPVLHPTLPFPLRKYLVPNTIISPDAVTYVGPLPGPQTVTFPRWMYNPVLPPVIVVNQTQVNQLIALNTGWTVNYLAPYPVPNFPPKSVAAMVPSGITDNFQPAGSNPGFTSRYELMPTDGTSTLAGFAAGGDGWTIEIFNPHPALALQLLNGASATLGNSFILPNGLGGSIPAQGGSFFQWLSAVKGWMAL